MLPLRLLEHLTGTQAAASLLSKQTLLQILKQILKILEKYFSGYLTQGNTLLQIFSIPHR